MLDGLKINPPEKKKSGLLKRDGFPSTLCGGFYEYKATDGVRAASLMRCQSLLRWI